MSSGLVEFELWSRSRYPAVEVAGESFHQDAIRRLFKARGMSLPDAGTAEVEARALLVPDPGNRHDRNAVQVWIEGYMIGHLPRETAATHVGTLTSLTRNGLQPVTTARVRAYEREAWTGTDRRGRDVYESTVEAWGSVTLDEAHLCVPANLPPSSGHALLPQGPALQFRGEEKHLDVLAPFVKASGAAWVYGTLSAVSAATSRSAKTVVEASIEGRVIGELTPAMSSHFTPTIEHLEQQGLRTAARILLTGNAIKVEAVLYASKSHEIPAAWFAGLTPESDRLASAELLPVDASRPSVIIPPKPQRIEFNLPPGWPALPEGWEPVNGWTALPEWPVPPPGWQFWVMR